MLKLVIPDYTPANVIDAINVLAESAIRTVADLRQLSLEIGAVPQDMRDDAAQQVGHTLDLFKTLGESLCQAFTNAGDTAGGEAIREAANSAYLRVLIH